jgi:superfamily II RNA helicase
MINTENKNINNSLINLIKKLFSNEFFPVVVFCNSKNECEKNSEDLFKHISVYNENLSTINKRLSIRELRKKGYNKKIDFNSAKEKEDLEKEYNKILSKLFKDYQKLDIFRSYLELIKAGIGYYHNDMFPFLKELVEIFFQKQYIKVLFSTENFYLPTKTVVLTSLFKSKENRFITGNEYYNISERVGRINRNKKKYEQYGNIIIMLNEEIKKEKN